MSNEQLARIESKLDGVLAGQSTLVDRMTKVEHGQATLAHGLQEVQTHLIRVDTRLDKLEVNAEVMRDDIKQIAEGHAVTQAAIAKSTETVVAHIDRRIEPIERAVRALFGSRS